MSLFEARQCPQCAAKDATIAALSISINHLREEFDNQRRAQSELITQLLARVPGEYRTTAPINFGTPLNINHGAIEDGFQQIFDEEGFESVIIPSAED